MPRKLTNLLLGNEDVCLIFHIASVEQIFLGGSLERVGNAKIVTIKEVCNSGFGIRCVCVY
jgi:hypothetical protein